jgi:threonine/homoserine/homoserine lactone efflux protein
VEKFTLLQNVLLGLTLAAPIGPVNVEIIKRGLNAGFRQAFLTGTGAMCADATYLTLIPTLTANAVFLKKTSIISMKVSVSFRKCSEQNSLLI